MRGIAAWTTYIVMQVLFVPMAIVGAVLTAYAEVFVSKKLGVSGTAAMIADDRLAMSWFGLRSDQATVRLARTLPNLPGTGLWLLLFPWWIRYKMCGKNVAPFVVPMLGEESYANMIVARTIYVDRIIQKASGRAAQFVSLGAGYDTRSFGRLRAGGLQCFELDQAATQRLKRSALQRAGIDTSHVHFVESAFQAGTWARDLVAAGYDASKPSIFLWEGVTAYLTEMDVRKTLRTLRSIAAPGSTLVCDFVSWSIVNGKYSGWARLSVMGARITHEAMRFGVDFPQGSAGALDGFLASEGLSAGDTYLLGSRTKRGTFLAVVEVKL